MHYSDVRKDLKGYVAKIAKFLEVDLNKEELKTVTERCSIQHMKKVNKFNYKMPLSQDKGKWDVNNDHILYSGSIIKKGEIGTGESYTNNNDHKSSSV